MEKCLLFEIYNIDEEMKIDQSSGWNPERIIDWFLTLDFLLYFLALKYFFERIKIIDCEGI